MEFFNKPIDSNTVQIIPTFNDEYIGCTMTLSIDIINKLIMSYNKLCVEVQGNKYNGTDSSNDTGSK